MVTGDELAAWVTASCLAQGVPVKVTDPYVLAQVGVLLTGRPGAPHPRGAREERTGRPVRAARLA